MGGTRTFNYWDGPFPIQFVSGLVRVGWVIGDSVAEILAYCQCASHDLYFYYIL